MCHKSRPVCGAALTAINDTVAQTGQEVGRAAMSSACKLLSRSVEYSGKAAWQSASGVFCAEIERVMWGGQGRRMSLCSHHNVQQRRRKRSARVRLDWSPQAK